MGYYTTHSLKVKNSDDEAVIKKALEDHAYGEDTFKDSHKWYDQNEHCLAVSKAYPSIMFAVEGQGEEQGDVWQRVYLGGERIREWSPEPFKFPEL